MKIKQDNKFGFSLFEVIVTLIILGIVVAGGTAFFSNLIVGYIQARDTLAVAEKIQLALTRVNHEVANINTSNAATYPFSFTGNVISYYYRNETTLSTISLNGTNLQLNGATLLDNVSSFTVTQPYSYGVRIVLNVNIVTGKVTTSRIFDTTINLPKFAFQ